MLHHLILGLRDKKNAFGVLGDRLRPASCEQEDETVHLVYLDAELAARAAATLVVFGFAFRVEHRE